MRHVHERKDQTGASGAICFLNIMLFLPDECDEAVEDANKTQSAQEAKLRASLESISYSEQDATQAAGPLAPFVVPIACNRSGAVQVAITRCGGQP